MRKATKAAFSPSHNATPVQIIVAMMRSPTFIDCGYASIWQEWRSPDEYGLSTNIVHAATQHVNAVMQ